MNKGFRLATWIVLLVLIGSNTPMVSLGAFCTPAPQGFPQTWNWVVQPIGDRPSLRGVIAVNPQVAWVSGNQGTIARTTDGGQNWQLVTHSDFAKLDFRDIHAWDENRAVVLTAGQPARCYATKDGGCSWQMTYESKEPSAFFDAMEFDAAGNGLAFSDPINGKLLLIRSKDRGQTWQEVTADQSPTVATGEAGFAASGSCLALLGNQVWIGLGGLYASPEANPADSATDSAAAVPVVDPQQPPRARVWRNTLDGKTWQLAETPLESNLASGVFSLKFCTPQIGVAVGGDYQQIDQRTMVACFTRDGGATWQTPVAMPSGYRSAVAFLPYKGKRFWVSVGPNGTDGSDDDGEHWAPLSLEGFHAVSFTPDGQLGIAVGADGRIGRWRPQ